MSENLPSKKTGHPLKEIDWKKVDELMIAGCLGTEIAAYFGIHPDTFYKRVELEKGMGFSAYLQKMHSKGDALLRAHQYAKSLGLTDKGDNTLLIWLGKTRLKQKEETNPASKFVFEVNYGNDAENKIQVLPKEISTSDPESS